MPKYIDSISEAIDGQNKGVWAHETYEQINKAEAESKIILKYTTRAQNDPWKDDAMELAEILDKDTLVYNSEPMVGGIPQWFLDFFGPNQPVLKFIGEQIASVAIQNLITRGVKPFIKLFKRSTSESWKRPWYIFVQGANGGNLQFRFFAHFDEEDIENALKAIPATIEEIGFQEDYGKLLFFDTKRKKWFQEGFETEWPPRQKKPINS